MRERLSWSIIQDFFHDEWVELADVEWDLKRPFPTRARVLRHSPRRVELFSNASKSSETVVLFVRPGCGLVQYDGVESRL